MEETGVVALEEQLSRDDADDIWRQRLTLGSNVEVLSDVPEAPMGQQWIPAKVISLSGADVMLRFSLSDARKTQLRKWFPRASEDLRRPETCRRQSAGEEDPATSHLQETSRSFLVHPGAPTLPSA